MLINETRLETIAGGAVQEKFDEAMTKVCENILDPKTPDKAVREITIKLRLTPLEDREDVVCEVGVSCKLAQEKPIRTGFVWGESGGNMALVEYGKQVKGQTKMEMPDVDRSTGEVLNFRKKVGDAGQ